MVCLCVRVYGPTFVYLCVCACISVLKHVLEHAVLAAIIRRYYRTDICALCQICTSTWEWGERKFTRYMFSCNLITRGNSTVDGTNGYA